MKPISLQPNPLTSRRIYLVFLILGAGLLVLGYLAWQVFFGRTGSRGTQVWAWLSGRDVASAPTVRAGERCGEAPFIMPTDGLVGFIWGDSFRPGHMHQGIDVFGGALVGQTPVVAAYPGYLSRLPDWKSTVIIRVPSDPLNPGQQIWTYYTHMADEQGASYISDAFPAGTSEVYVEAGTLLGYQGNYSGDPNNPVGVHLHFSIVKDNGAGEFLNELEIKNTNDPTPYLGLALNAWENQDSIPFCPATGGEE